MIYATLGKITFELLTITGLDEKCSYQFAEHQVIEGKPLLQFIGDNLDETSLAARFHVNFCDPPVEYAALKAEADKHEALVLQFADGAVAGRRVITEIRKTIETTADNGRALSIEVKLTLREWYDPAPIVTQQIRQKKIAPALQGKGTVSSPAPAPVNSAALAAGKVTSAGADISRQAAQTATLADTLKQNYAALSATADSVKQQAAEITANVAPMVQSANNMANNAKAASDQIKGYATQISGISSNITRITAGLPAPANTLGDRIGAVNRSISAKSNQVITVAEVNGSRADETATRAGMISRMLPRVKS